MSSVFHCVNCRVEMLLVGEKERGYNYIMEDGCVLGGITMFDIRKWAQQKSVDIVKVVDISTLSEIENRGFPRAILLVNILPKDLVNKIIREEEDTQQIFSDVEHQTDEIADQLAEAIHEAGYHAISQSEKGIGIRNE